MPGLYVEYAGTKEMEAVTVQGEAQESDLELLRQVMKWWFNLP